MKPSVFVGAAFIIAVLICGVFYFWDNSGPTVSISPASGAISGKKELALTLQDKSGLRDVSVSVDQGGKSIPLLAKQYPPKTATAHEKVSLQQGQGLKEGPVKLVVTATDRSIFHFGAGNKSTQSMPFDYQNKPPTIVILSTAHNIARGGVGLVVYTVNREVERTGVVFADRFFPGYRQSGDLYACLFPFPYDLPDERFVPKVFAEDKAGNQRLMGIYYHVIPKRFPSDKLELPDSYLDKVSAEFKERFPQAATPLDVFLKANRELRSHDLKVLGECGLKTSPVPLWQGEFLRLPNSAPRGVFAQARSYFYHGKLIDQQTHLGIDLASLQHANVPAANNGKVVYADELGIYGECVIIDHGLGLQTLYGHLSKIGVKVGDVVKKGDIIGNTGDTGLAGGDHLHYGVVVSGEQVNPIEWWDPSWIKNNVTGKLEEAKQRREQ